MLHTIQVQERAVTKHAFLRLPHRKCMGKSLIGCKCWSQITRLLLTPLLSSLVIWLAKKLFVLRKNPLTVFFTVFQDSAQLVHTIPLVLGIRWCRIITVSVICYSNMYANRNDACYAIMVIPWT